MFHPGKKEAIKVMNTGERTTEEKTERDFVSSHRITLISAGKKYLVPSTDSKPTVQLPANGKNVAMSHKTV